MFTFLARRPLAAALSALTLASFGTAFAAPESPQRERAVPEAPAFPDIGMLKAQTNDMAQRFRNSEAMLLALDDELLGLPPSMAFFANEFGHPREIVKNAPYSAEAVTESVQLLPDGNRILRKSTILLARDGAGRTRQERKGDGRYGVYIYDPMERRSVVLDETTRTATRIPRVPEMPSPPEPAMPPGALPPMSGAGSREPDVQPGRVIVRRKAGGGDEAGDSEDVHVDVIRIGRGERAGAVPPMPPLPPLMLPIVPRGKGETKSLGSREFDSIKADGTMTSHTIPAGEIGNEKPIVVTSERWFSPELHVVVFAKTSDPRAGETTYRLTNVKKGEPSAELFKIPADYRTRGEGRKSS